MEKTEWQGEKEKKVLALEVALGHPGCSMGRICHRVFYGSFSRVTAFLMIVVQEQETACEECEELVATVSLREASLVEMSGREAQSRR